MRNVAGKTCGENQNRYFIFSNFFTKVCAVFEIMWKNKIRPDKRPMTV